MNVLASKMKLFMTLVDGLFRKQLNNITKNPISYDPKLPLYLVFQGNVCNLFIRKYGSRVYGRLRARCALKQGAQFNMGIG